jgi:hypothetical protein
MLCLAKPLSTDFLKTALSGLTLKRAAPLLAITTTRDNRTSIIYFIDNGPAVIRA